jgi:hypothetical protein
VARVDLILFILSYRSNMKSLVFVGAIAALLYGCAAVNGPLTQDEVAGKVSVRAGYQGCRDCDQIKTYTGPMLNRSRHYAEPQFSGWLNLSVRMNSTNQGTAEHIQKYRLESRVIANGGFHAAQPLANDTSGVHYWLVLDDGTYAPLAPISAREGFECFSNIGSGCSWTDMVEIPTRTVEEAYKAHTGIRLFVGEELTQSSYSNDGYAPVRSQQTVRKGEIVELSPEYVGGFVGGLIRLGAAVPSATREQAIADADSAMRQALVTTNAAAATIVAEDKARTRPLKMKIGTRVCQRSGPWIKVAFTEAASTEKIQLRIVEDMLATNPHVREGGFHEMIIWDRPDNWYLCDN